MSSLYYKTYDQSAVRSAIQYVGFNEQMDFADYIRTKVAESGLSYRDIADKANRNKKLLAHSTIGDIINRRNLNPSSKTITGLSIGLGITESEILKHLELPKRKKKKEPDKITEEEFLENMKVMFSGVEDLSKDEQKQVMSMLRVLANDVHARLKKKLRFAE